MDHPWDECVLSHPKGSVYHHSAWIKVITSTYHYEPFLVASKDAKSGRTNGIAPFLFIHSWLTGKRLVSLPFTSYCDWLIPESAFLQLIDFVLKIGSSRKNVGEIACGSPFREHGREDFQPQVLLVAQSVRTALDDADLVVEALDEAKRDLVLGPAISGDPIPMTLDHLSELLVRLEALPLEARLPVVEETPRPAFPLVAPQLAEGFFQQVGGIEPLVGGQQGLQRLPAVRGQILVAGQQDVLLTLDVAPILALQPGVLGLAHLVQGVVQVPHHMEFVEQDGGLGRPLGADIAEGFPHIHHRQPDAMALPLTQPLVELFHAGLRAILAAKPDRPGPDQIAHHEAIGVSLADRYLVDANCLGSRHTGSLQLGRHVLLVQFLDGVPVQMQLLGDVLNCARPTAPADKPGKPLRVERSFGKEIELLAPHLAATAALQPPNFEFQIDPRVAAGQIPHPPCRAVVPARVRPTTFLADRFFERRTRVMTRAFESPKTPRTPSSGQKPTNRYASRRRLRLREVAIATSCQFPQHYRTAGTRIQQGLQAIQ